MASLDKYFNSAYSSLVNYTVSIDTNSLDLSVGEYTIEYWMEFYSIYEWHEAPKRYTETLKVIKNICKGNHSFEEWLVLIEPTCSEEGSTIFECTKCEHRIYQKTSKNHVYGKWSYENVNSHKKICNACDEYIEEEHSWNKGVITTPPTCIEEGVKTYTCSLCDGVKTETLPKTRDHSFGNWENSSDKEHTRKCKDCDLTQTESHNFENGWSKDNSGHWHKCSICKTEKDYGEHIVISNTSNKCEICGTINILGDTDEDEIVGANDAIHLLYHVFFGETRYPVNQDCDFDGNGSIEAADAIYLLYHVFFGGDRYPLN